ncbi:MAG: hypothetical protein ACREI9_08600 [Nitrospiraceae bacterium]
MKWIMLSFFSVVILMSVLFTAGFEFIDLEGPMSTAQALPLTAR